VRISRALTATTIEELPWRMRVSAGCEIDRIVFDSGLVRVGAFRCHPDDPSFHDSGPARNCCFVFPRTAVEIQHEHEPAFVANPNVVTFYNQGQAYLRNAVSIEGDRCDWFGVAIDVVQDVVRTFDPALDAHPEQPFNFTRGWAGASIYLSQRRLFEQVVAGVVSEPLMVEESVVNLLEQVVRSAYKTTAIAGANTVCPKQRDIVHHIEFLLSRQWGECMTLRDLANEVGISVYHLCRMFRRATGSTLHQYRQKLRVRWSLEGVMESSRSLVDIALDAGFSSHSHYTSSFRQEFDQTPSSLRASKSSEPARRHRARF
jgi:AraC family transcriptional regulator